MDSNSIHSPSSNKLVSDNDTVIALKDGHDPQHPDQRDDDRMDVDDEENGSSIDDDAAAADNDDDLLLSKTSDSANAPSPAPPPGPGPAATASSAITTDSNANANAAAAATTATTTTTTTTVAAAAAAASSAGPSSGGGDSFDVEILSEDYESIAIMIDELMKDDPAVRIKAIRSLPIISKALGAERTRNELIPYITQMIDDDDEVLLVLMEEIYRLLTLRLIGGASPRNNEHSFCLIPPFERLCCVEEKVIRDEAVAKFGRILHEMPYDAAPHYFASYVLPLLQRLCGSEWHTARMSGATLIADTFSRLVPLLEAAAGDAERERLSAAKEALLGLLRDLVADSIPIVRRQALVTLGAMVRALSGGGEGHRAARSEEAVALYLPLFKKLAGDEQDNVRVFAVETLLAFWPLLGRPQVADHLLYHIRLLALDSAWRVRYIAADHFIALCSMLDAATIRDSMSSYFVRLLEDQEPEVRAVAISKIPGICRLIGAPLAIERLIPAVKALVADSNKYARASLASVLIPFCHLLPHHVVTEQLLQCILSVLKDRFPNVRLHVISTICNEAEAEGDGDGGGGDGNGSGDGESGADRFDIALLEESIIPSVLELTLDSDWRVRLGIIDKFAALAKCFGPRFFAERLFELSLAALEDNVADIRQSAASNLLAIAKVLDAAEADPDGAADREPLHWASNELFPSLLRKARASKHYLHRIAYLRAFRFLAEGMGPLRSDAVIAEILHFLEKDPVANVRFKAAQIVAFLADHDRIRRALLEDLAAPKLDAAVDGDDDPDVVYFAQQCRDAVRRAMHRR